MNAPDRLDEHYKQSPCKINLLWIIYENETCSIDDLCKFETEIDVSESYPIDESKKSEECFMQQKLAGQIVIKVRGEIRRKIQKQTFSINPE